MDGIAEIPLPGASHTTHTTHGKPGDRHATLRGFHAGPENHLVPAAVQAVLENECREYNPVVFHGPSGTGKSHLALGLAAAWRELRPRQKVSYITAADFSRELTDAIAVHEVDQLRERFRGSSLSIFENIGRLAGKRVAQQELLHLLEELLWAGRSVVMTASAPPAAMTKLLPELRSRLTAGLTVPLSPPGLQTRQALLVTLAEQQAVKLSRGPARVLAEGLPVTVPELCGAMAQLAVAAQVAAQVDDRGVIDVDTARRYLADRKKTDRPAHKAPTLPSIGSATARHFALRLSELRSSSRRRPVVTARGVAMYLARRLTGNSLQQIGRYFGDRDHTTVMHACHRTESLLSSDRVVQQAVEQLQEKWSHV